MPNPTTRTTSLGSDPVSLAAVGIASANYFTARYLTPLAEAGYIAVEGGEKNRYVPDKRYKLLRKGKAVADA